MGMIITYLAVASWCAMAYLLPIVAVIVWRRRRRDETKVIQFYETGEYWILDEGTDLINEKDNRILQKTETEDR